MTILSIYEYNKSKNPFVNNTNHKNNNVNSTNNITNNDRGDINMNTNTLMNEIQEIMDKIITLLEEHNKNRESMELTTFKDKFYYEIGRCIYYLEDASLDISFTLEHLAISMTYFEYEDLSWSGSNYTYNIPNIKQGLLDLLHDMQEEDE